MSQTTPQGRPIREPNPQRGPACFAPPLTSERLAAYKSLAAGAEPPVREAMEGLIRMAEVFQETPASALPGVPLQTEYTRSPFRDAAGKPKPPPDIVPLSGEEIDRIWDHVPWDHEIRALEPLFEAIDPRSQKELRDAAFHLKWYATELALDREPMTQDRL